MNTRYTDAQLNSIAHRSQATDGLDFDQLQPFEEVRSEAKWRIENVYSGGRKNLGSSW